MTKRDRLPPLAPQDHLNANGELASLYRAHRIVRNLGWFLIAAVLFWVGVSRLVS